MREALNGGGLIFAVGHIGNNEAVAAAHRPSRDADQRRWPTTRRSRRSSRSCAASARDGASSIIPWRNMRDDLRRAAAARDARPARRLGLSRRRHPGPAVRRVDDAARRPATLAAKTGSRILPITHPPPARRHVPRHAGRADRRRRPPTRPSCSARPRRSPTPSPRRSPRRPDQWYSFKPIWPATAEEAADLERRAAADAGGRSPTRAGAGVRLTVRRLALQPAGPRGLLGARRGSPAGCPSARWSALAELAGDLWYRPRPSAPPRRGATCARVATGSPPTSAGGPASSRRATTRARSSASCGLAYRHAARYYLEVARAPGMRRGDVDERIVVETPERRRRGVHAGRAVDLRRPALRRDRAAGAAARDRASARPVAPMETLDDPALQAWFVRTRGAVGIRIVGLREARRELLGRAAGGHERRPRRRSRPDRRRHRRPSCSARRPRCRSVRRCSPSRAARPVYVVGRPAGRRGRYIGRLERVDVAGRGHPPRARDRDDGLDRARRSSASSRTRRSNGGPSSSRSGRTSRPARGDASRTGARPGGPRERRRRPRPTRPGRADLHIHTVASDGTADVVAILDHVARRDDLDVIAITDHERIDAALAGAGDRPRPRPARSRSSSARRSRRSAATCSRCWIERPIQPYRSLRATIAEIHDAGGLAIPAHPLVPYPLCAQGWVLRRLLDDATTPSGRTRSRPSTRRRSAGRGTIGSCASPTSTASPGSATATRTRSRRSASGWTTFAGRDGRRPAAGDRGAARPTTAARSTARPARSGSSAGSSEARPRRPGRARRADPARRHGPRPRLSRRPRSAAALRPRPDSGVKIGLVCPYIYPASGGVAQHVRFLYENLRLRGHDVRILTASHGPQRASEGDIIRLGVGLLGADQRVGRDAHVLAPLPEPDRRRCSSASGSTSSTSTSRSCRSCRSSCCANHEREHRDVPRLCRLLAVLRVRQSCAPRVRRRGCTAGSRSAPRLATSSTASSRATTRSSPTASTSAASPTPSRSRAGRTGRRTCCSSGATSRARGCSTCSRRTVCCARSAANVAAARRRLRPAGARGAALRRDPRSQGRRVPRSRVATPRRRSCSRRPTCMSRRRPAASRSASSCSRRWPPGRPSCARTSTATRAWSGAVARALLVPPRAAARARRGDRHAHRRSGAARADGRGRAGARRGVQLAAGDREGRGLLRVRHPPPGGRRDPAEGFRAEIPQAPPPVRAKPSTPVPEAADDEPGGPDLPEREAALARDSASASRHTDAE